MIESPTGLGIRNDSRGSGNFGAPRGKRKHNGLDFECIPGQAVKCPIESGTIIRKARPYADDLYYSGLVIENDRITLKLFYCDILPGLIGKTVKRDQAIATAQDISKKYSKDMMPHIHLKIEKIDPTLLMELQDTGF